MNSPILLLVAWFVINLIIKSAKDKQKIEEARRKRATQIENNPRNIKTGDINRETLQRDVKKAISTIREEIDKQRKQSTITKETKREVPKRETPKREVPKRDKPLYEKAEVSDKTKIPNNLPERNKTGFGKPVMESREDIIRGIIFSEILSEPKSIQNLKRSM